MPAVNERVIRRPVKIPECENAMKAGTMTNQPGWDAKEIKRIASEHFDGYADMFEKHGWPERGQAMMPSVQKNVARDYGTVSKFAERFRSKNNG